MKKLNKEIKTIIGIVLAIFSCAIASLICWAMNSVFSTQPLAGDIEPIDGTPSVIITPTPTSEPQPSPHVLAGMIMPVDN